MCRRLQFAFMMYVASTVHKVMGDRVQMLSTQITEFQLTFWSKEQFYVLLSRERDLSRVTSVGNKLTTLNCIQSTLLKEHDLLTILANTTICCTSSSTAVKTSELLSPFPIAFADIPVAFAFCYLLRSLKFQHLYYIGRCKNLHRRLREHNCGY